MAAFEKLLTAARPNLYRMNAFRVADLASDATDREIKRREQMLKVYQKTGQEYQGQGPLPIKPAPARDSMLEAVIGLHDPERRLVDEFFWLWTHAPAVHQNGTASIGTNFEEMVRTWKRADQRKDREGSIARHNLAVLSHAQALDLEYVDFVGNFPLSGEQVKARANHWTSALYYWGNLVDETDFWSLLADRISDKKQPQLTHEMVQQFRARLPEFILSINAQLAVDAAYQGRLADTERHRRLLEESGFAPGAIEATLHKAVEPLRAQIDVVCQSADTDGEADPARADQAARGLLDETEPILGIVDYLLPKADVIAKAIHDRVGECALGSAINYANKTNRWEEAAELMAQIRPVVVGRTARDHLQSFWDWLKKNHLSNSTSERLENEMALGEKVRPFQQGLGVLRSAAKAEAARHPGRADVAARNLLEKAKPLLKKIDGVVQGAHATRLAAHDRVILEVLGCVKGFLNHGGDRDVALDLLKAVRGVPGSSSAKARVQETHDYLDRVQRHTRVLHSLGFEQPDIGQVLSGNVGPIEKRLEHLCRTARRDAAKDPARGDKVAQELLQQAKPCLTICDEFLPAGNPARKKINERFQETYQHVARTQRHHTILQSLGFAKAEVERVLNGSVKPLQNRIEQLCSAAVLQAAANPALADATARKLMADAKPCVTLWEELLPADDPLRKRIVDRFHQAHDQVARVHRHHAILQPCGFGQAEVETILCGAAEPLQTRIEHLCRTARNDAATDPVRADEIAKQLLFHAKPCLTICEDLLPADDPRYGHVHEQVKSTSDHIERVQRHHRILQPCGFDKAELERVLSGEVGPLRTRVDQLCRAAMTSAAAHPARANEAARQLLQNAKPCLTICDDLLPPGDSRHGSVHDQIASKALDCETAFASHAADKPVNWRTSREILGLLQAIVRDATLGARILERNQEIADRLKHAICWFCNVRDREGWADSSLKLYQGYDSTRSCLVRIPRCIRCKCTHTLENSIWYGSVVLGLTVAPALLYLQWPTLFWRQNSLVTGIGLIGIFFGFGFLGALIGEALGLGLRRKTKAASDVQDCEVLRVKRAQGWTLQPKTSS